MLTNMSGVLYVAEMGSQHKGNIALACRYAYEFKQAGADIIKMQFGHDPGDPIRHVSREMAEQMAAYCKDIGIQYMASIFSPEGLWLADHLGMNVIKMAHQKNDDIELWKLAMRGGRVIYAATSGDQMPHRDVGNTVIWPIYTTSQYPTAYADLKMPSFKPGLVGQYQHYGYSDHTIGLGACLLAVARGARYIEKHVCLDPTDLWTRDTSFSATPAQFAELVRLGREIEQVRDAGI